VTDVSIGPARRDELPRILELLEVVGLPPDGLANHLSTTLLARRDVRVVGSAALEFYGPAADRGRPGILPTPRRRRSGPADGEG
jgi:hypothetical protein